MSTMSDHHLQGTGHWKRSAEQIDREYRNGLRKLKRDRFKTRQPILGAVPITLRYPCSCGACRTKLEPGIKVWFAPKQPNGRRITCSACHSPLSDKGLHKGFDGSAKITDSDGKPI
jgi:hypothetical protein